MMTQKNNFVRLLKKIYHFFLKFQKKIKVDFEINTRITDDTIVHLLFNDKFASPYVDFVNKKFVNKNHLFLCKRWFSKYSFPHGSNVIEIKSYDYIKLEKANKIICHSLFDTNLIDLLYERQELSKKSYWVIWGGDLTDITITDKKKFVFSNFKGYIGKMDEDFARKHLDISSNISFYDATYIFPVDINVLKKVKIVKKDYLQIQLGQSVQISILDSLEAIKRYRNENIRVCVILSYGGDGVTEEKIKKKGIELFGNKFFVIENYMSADDYAQHIAENDILILNADHQNAFGNTLAHLYLGKKVFIRDDIQTPAYLKQKGIIVYPTQEIENIDFNEFKIDRNRENNTINTEKLLNEANTAEEWRNIFLA